MACSNTLLTRADDHDAFQRNVDDAGVLTEHTAQSHQHQHACHDSSVYLTQNVSDIT